MEQNGSPSEQFNQGQGNYGSQFNAEKIEEGRDEKPERMDINNKNKSNKSANTVPSLIDFGDGIFDPKTKQNSKDSLGKFLEGDTNINKKILSPIEKKK